MYRLIRGGFCTHETMTASYRLCFSRIREQARCGRARSSGVLASLVCQSSPLLGPPRRCFSTISSSDDKNSLSSSQHRLTAVTLANPVSPLGTRTKIVCTLGPASDTEDRIQELVSNGMHVARLNFSHAGNDYSYPEANLGLVRKARGRHDDLHVGSTLAPEQRQILPKNLRAILVDTKGPEIRTGPLQGNADVVEIATGAPVELTILEVSSDAAPTSPEGPHRLQVDYQSIARTLQVGSIVLLDDGLLALEVVDVDHANHQFVACRALNGGPIKKNKGVNLPDAELDLPALTEKDKQDLKWACEVGADYVAASFIRTAGNVRSVIAYLDRCIAELPSSSSSSSSSSSTLEGGPAEVPLRPLVISKIESKEGVENFDEILKESDGIMVARGDLGVEIPYSKVFAAQKMMVSKCNLAGKPAIVATQMLDSMQRNPRPTRAEVTDVGTAVLDGADAVMLSGETAAGKYPIESITSMVSVVTEADAIVDSKDHSLPHEKMPKSSIASTTSMDEELAAVAASAVQSAKGMKAKYIIVITATGSMARAVALHRPTVPVLAFCTNVQVARRLQLHRAIIPIMLQGSLNPLSSKTLMSVVRAEAIRTAKELGFVKTGDRVVAVDRSKGKPHEPFQFAHNMQVLTVRDM